VLSKEDKGSKRCDRDVKDFPKEGIGPVQDYWRIFLELFQRLKVYWWTHLEDWFRTFNSELYWEGVWVVKGVKIWGPNFKGNKFTHVGFGSRL